jgi:hypothetical protein
LPFPSSCLLMTKLLKRTCGTILHDAEGKWRRATGRGKTDRARTLPWYLSFHVCNIHATRYGKCRFRIASRNNLKKYIYYIFFVSVKRTFICTNWHNPGPQSQTGVNKNYFAFRRTQFRLLPKISANLSRIFIHFFPRPSRYTLKERKFIFFPKVIILRRHLYIWLYMNYATGTCN